MITSLNGASGFHDPDASHWPIAYWFWHRLPKKAEIERQVQEMYDGGYRTMLIQCRLAFPQDQYLTQAYLRAYQVAVKTAHEVGVQVGIYDEYNWQSGMAGGLTVQNHDHLRERHVFWAVGPAQSRTTLSITGIHSSVEELGQDALLWQYEDGRIEWSDWTILAAVTYPRRGPSPGAVEEVTPNAHIAWHSKSGCRITVLLPQETLTDRQVAVFVAARCYTSRIPNYLLAESAQRFIDVGYEPFRRALNSYFGNTIRYFFFDQPHHTFYGWTGQYGNLISSLPFAPELIDITESHTRQSFSVTLLALIEDLGAATPSIRADFYETFKNLVMHRYIAPLRAWADKNGVGFTGHEALGHVGSWNLYDAFPQWDLRVNFGLDYFGLDSYRTLTTVDGQGLDAQLSAKLGDSQAQTNGRSGTIVEQYFVSKSGTSPNIGRWDLTLEELRAQAIRLHLSGARQILFHAYYQTDGQDNNPRILKNPRFDFAPGINFEPWWPFHRAFAKESARLSMFLDGAQPCREIAVLYPLRTAWVQGPSHSHAHHLGDWARYLGEKGYSYRLVDERDLRQDPTLWVGKNRFSVLVLPSVTTLQDGESLWHMKRFLDDGGLVLTSGDTPRFYQYPGRRSLKSDWDEMERRYARIHTSFEPPSTKDRDDDLRFVPSARPHPTDQGHPLWQWVGREATGWRVVLFNDQPSSTKTHLELPSTAHHISRWDISTGDIVAIGGVPATRIPLDIDPMEVVCLRVASASPWTTHLIEGYRTGPSLTHLLATSQRTALPSGWSLSIHGTTIPLDPSNLTIPWEELGWSDFSGEAAYTTRLTIKDPEGSWWLYLPYVGTAVTCLLNGVTVGKRAWSPFVFALSAVGLKKGHNSLTVKVVNTAANRYLRGVGANRPQTASGLLAVPELLWQPTPLSDSYR